MTAPESSGAAPLCATCGAPIHGRFCARCGAPADPGSCPACRSPLSPGARFCHRCGAPAGGAASGSRRETVAWIVAGVALVLAVGAIAFRVGSTRPTVPDMANAGNATGGAGLPTRAPDISQMSPQERFDRLFDRVMRAASAGDSATVVQFSPMALGAYEMLDRADADSRYHAAMIHLAIGQVDAARALADTILAETPTHLFGFLIRGDAADRANDVPALNASYRAFLQHYEAELRSGRVEYREHQPALDDFRTRARATLEK